MLNFSWKQWYQVCRRVTVWESQPINSPHSTPKSWTKKIFVGPFLLRLFHNFVTPRRKPWCHVQITALTKHLVGPSIQGYDWEEIKIWHCLTIFPKPLYRVFYSENILWALRTHEYEIYTRGWRNPTCSLNQAKHLCVLNSCMLSFHP